MGINISSIVGLSLGFEYVEIEDAVVVDLFFVRFVWFFSGFIPPN